MERPSEVFVADSFGAQLRACRTAAGVSIGELARRVNYHKSYLSKVENGHKPPTVVLAKLCDAALETGGVLASLVLGTVDPQVAEEADAEELAGEAWYLGFTAPGGIRFTHRDALPDTGDLAAFVAVPGPRQQADKQVLEILRAGFEQYRMLGMAVSPALVLGPLIAHLRTIRGLVPGTPEPDRTDALRLAARVAEYIGWMTQEAGDDRVAAWWTAQAVLFARESDDPQTVGYALVRRAELALYRQDSLATVDLAARAQLEQDVGPRVLGLAARCEAQGHALAGNAADCMIALGRATDLLREAAEADPPTMPVLGSSVGAEEARLALGWSLFDLGRPQEAAEVLTASLDSIPSHSHRARARFSVRLALSHAHAGDVGQSCARIRSVLDQVIRVDSATIRADLRMLARVLNRWPTDAAVLRTRPMLIQALTAAVGE